MSERERPAETVTPAHVAAELTFTARTAVADPFHEIVLDVLVTAPDGALLRVPAFWAGGDVWKARIASGQEGVHAWRTDANRTDDPGLHGVEGTLRVVPYTGDNPLHRHGPVRVAPDRRRLQHADGTPFLWLGDTWWMGLCHRLGWPEDFQRLTAHRKAQGFNVVQLVAGLYPDMHPFDPRGANEAGFPWEEGYARIRPEYFDAADARIGHLVAEGIVPCIVGAWGYFLPWMGEARMRAHWRYLVARYGAWPVVWCAGGEANLPWYQAENFPSDDQAVARRWCAILRHIRQIDPWRRPLTIHPTAINAHTARHVADDEALLDFDFLQTPHDGPGFTVEAVTAQTVIQSRASDPVMPVINGEASYENLLDRIPASRPRAMFWLCMTNGAAGHTYGANGIWQVNRPGQPHGPSPSAGSPPTGYGAMPWDEAMHLPGGRQIAAGMRWLATLPWWTFSPHFTWAAWAGPPRPTGGGAPIATEGIADAVAPGAIGRTDGHRLFYLLHDRDVALRQLEPGRVYRVTHFDPVETLAPVDGGELVADHKGEAVVAAPGHGHDWVLLLTPQAEG